MIDFLSTLIFYRFLKDADYESRLWYKKSKSDLFTFYKSSKADSIDNFPPNYKFNTKRPKLVRKIRTRKLRQSSTYRYLMTWEDKLFFHSSLDYMFIFLYASPTLNSYNQLMFPFNKKILFYYRKDKVLQRGSSTRCGIIQAGDYRSDDFLFWKYDRLNYLKEFYELEDTKSLLSILIWEWRELEGYPIQRIPHRFQKNPWWSRKKGAYQKIDRMYQTWSQLNRDLLVIGEQNKCLIPFMIGLISKCYSVRPEYFEHTALPIWDQVPEEVIDAEEVFDNGSYIDPVIDYFSMIDRPPIGPEFVTNELKIIWGGYPLGWHWEDRNTMEIRKCDVGFFTNMNYFYKKPRRDILLKKLLSSLPLPYWSIYSYLIDNWDLRKYMVEVSSKHVQSGCHKGHPWSPECYFKNSSERLRGLPTERRIKDRFYKHSDYYD